MVEVSATELQQAVERSHRCKAKLLALQPVTETLEGKVVWQGIVSPGVV